MIAAIAGALAALVVAASGSNAAQTETRARASEAPAKPTIAETYLLVELGDRVLGTVLERGHIEGWACIFTKSSRQERRG